MLNVSPHDGRSLRIRARPSGDGSHCTRAVARGAGARVRHLHALLQGDRGCGLRQAARRLVPHCIRGKGCGIYETRPTDCRTFFCEWMLTTSLGAEWKPERAKFALVTGEGGHLTAFVDPGFPAAWRNTPYFETFKRWSLEGARARRHGSSQSGSARA